MNVSNVTSNATNAPAINYLEGEFAVIFYPYLIMNFIGVIIGPLGKKFNFIV